MFARNHYAVLLAAGLILLPAALHAQGARGGMTGQPGGAQMLSQLLESPAAIALEHRAELEITAEQATRLQALATSYEEDNETHLEFIRSRAEALEAARDQMQGQRGQMQGQRGQMQGQRGQMQGQRGQMQGAMAELQEPMQALRTARQRQLDTMGDILTANQLRELRQIMAPTGPRGPGARSARARWGTAPVAVVLLGSPARMRAMGTQAVRGAWLGGWQRMPPVARMQRPERLRR